MELEVVVGTYDGTIKGLSIDVLAPEEKVHAYYDKWSSYLTVIFSCLVPGVEEEVQRERSHWLCKGGYI